MEDILNYKVENESITILGFKKNKSERSIKIPDFIENKPVTQIAKEAFKSFTTLRNIEFCNNLQYIGDYAFYNSGLESVIIKPNIQHVGESCFEHCQALKNVQWMSPAVRISDLCFEQCNNLKSFDFSNVLKIGQAAFANSGLKAIKLEKNIESVGTHAFYECNLLSEVIWLCDCAVPSNCFNMNRQLSTFDFQHVSQIEKMAFAETGLTNIVLGRNILHISSYAFYNCKHLSQVDWQCKSSRIYPHCFEGCTSLGNFDFSSVREVGASAFSYSGLKTVALETNIKKVERAVFKGCVQLETVYWNCDADIRGNTFRKCGKLKTVEISDKVKNIETTAFNVCNKIEISFI